ncbi:MAG: pitrilysin family protein [Jatrophihabitans sp.]
MSGVPELTTPRAAKKLRSAEVTLDHGLRILAVRKQGVPIVEMRLRIPFLSGKTAHPAQATLLAEAMLTGAGDLDRSGLAAAIQGLGADLSVSVDADRLVIGGNALATNLRPLLDLVSSVVCNPLYAKNEVATERDRVLEKLTIARSRPTVVAGEALSRRMWGTHPYALDLPEADDVAAVTPAALRSLHKGAVRPGGALLVLVGDVTPAKMIELAVDALAPWAGEPTTARMPALPTPDGGPLLVIDRPGSVQSSIRMGRPALGRLDPDYPALHLANTIFGGYFSSRWNENIREDKGYTYGPHSRIEHHVLGSTLTLEVEVATEVTGPAMLETWYELGRISSLPVTAAELESVRQYAIGTLALSTATQSGLASTLSALSAFGLGLDWITQYPARLLATTVEDVSAAAERFFTPTGFTSVVVGDAATIQPSLAGLWQIEETHS